MKETVNSFGKQSPCPLNIVNDSNEPDELDGIVDWNIDFPESEEVDDNEGKLLTSLVRHSYIKHLRICLLSNYENWLKCFGGGVEISDKVIARCATAMELKALRKCMMVNIYQRTVMELAKHIKKSTELNKLHEDLFSAINSVPKNCDKAIQTESYMEREYSFFENCIESNKVPQLPNCTNEIPFLNSSASPRSELSGLNESVDTDELNLSTKSLNLSNFNDSIIKTDPPERSLKRKSVESDSCIKKRKSCSSGPDKSLEERLKLFDEIFGESNEALLNTPVKPAEKPNSTVQDYQSRYTKFFLTVNWGLEAEARVCELGRKLLSVSFQQRNALRKRFENLFGPSHGEEEPMEMTRELFSRCRRRTAQLVVTELSPRYENREIGSRLLFKTLAKEVTSVLLAESFAPEIEDVKKTVDEVFQDNMKYTSLEQVSLVSQKALKYHSSENIQAPSE